MYYLGKIRAFDSNCGVGSAAKRLASQVLLNRKSFSPQSLSLLWLILLIVALSTRSNSQTDSTVQTSASFAAVFFTEGLPDFPPIMHKGLAHPSFVTFPIGDSAGTIDFVRGGGKTGADEYWLIHHRSNKSIELRSITMAVADDSTLQDTVELEFDAVTRASSLLEIRLLPRYATLLYRWLGASPTHIGSCPPVELKHSGLEVGKPFPPLNLVAMDGRTWTNDETRGKIVVVNWWSIYCTPCREEIPGFNKLVEKYSQRSDIIFLAIAWNTTKDLHNFLDTTKFNYFQTISKTRTEEIFGLAFPRNIVVNQDGKIVYDDTGSIAEKYREIDAVIEKLINARHD